MNKELIDIGVEKYIKLQRHNDFKSWMVIIILLIIIEVFMLNKQTEMYNKKLNKFKMDYALMVAKKDKMFMDSLIRFADDNVIEKNIIK